MDFRHKRLTCTAGVLWVLLGVGAIFLSTGKAAELDAGVYSTFTKRECHGLECTNASAGVTQPSATTSPSSSTATSSTPATFGESNLEPPHGCDRTITADRGQFTSPNYPLKVTDFPRCRITIVAPPGFAPVIVFPEFEFMGSNDCSTGETFLQINAVEDHPELVCGSQKPFSVTADANVVVVDAFGTPDSFHWFSASFHSRSMVNVHFIMYEGVIGRFDANALEPSASGADGAHTALLLHAHPGSRVNVGFEAVLTDVDRPIRIQDVVTGNVLVELYGRHEHFSISSEGNELLLEYERGSTFELVFEYQLLITEEQEYAECDVTLLKQSGAVTSPGYPIAYPPSLDCTMTIRVGEDSAVRLVFLNFSVGSDMYAEGDTANHCVDDYVQVTDVTTDWVTRVCGFLHPFSWTSDDNEVMILLHSDDEGASTGFYAQYTAVEKNEDPDCLMVEGSEVFLRLPTDSDSPLPRCTALLSSPPKTILVIEVYHMDIPGREDCERQGLVFTDVVTERSDFYCGATAPFTWTSDGNEVAVSIEMNSATRHTRFRARYQVLSLSSRRRQSSDCKRTITERSGEINVPAVPAWPPQGSGDCLLLFHAAPNHRLRLVVKDLLIDVASHHSNKHVIHESDIEHRQMSLVNSDEVDFKIMDVTVRRESVGKAIELTTSQEAFTWTSETNEVIVTSRQLSADSTRVQFRVEFTTEMHESGNVPMGQCGRVVNDMPGILSVVSAPARCRIVFRARPSERVLVKITPLDTMKESTPSDDNDCDRAYLQITDVLTRRTERVCSLPGKLSFSWLSEGNELSILVHGNAWVLPFNVAYESIPQPPASPYQSFLVDPPGEFSSLLHASAARPGDECEIIVHAKSNERLNLRFREFLMDAVVMSRNHIRMGSDCQDQFAQVTDLTSKRSATFCGQSDLFSWTSDANVVRVLFRTQPGSVFNGFRTVYHTLERTEAEEVRLVNASSWNWVRQRFNGTGRITSPNYPESYPRGVRTEIVVHARPGHSIALVSSHFDLGSSEECQGDFLEILDLGTDKSLRICDRHAPFTWTSESNEVKITFKSDTHEEHDGYEIKYQDVTPVSDCIKYLELNESTQSVRMSTKHAIHSHQEWGYSNERGRCLFVIQGTPESRLRMTISDLEPFSFEIGSIQVMEVLHSRLSTYTLSDPRPWSFTSEGNALYVLMHASQERIPYFTMQVHAIRRARPAGCQRVIESSVQNSTLRFAGSGDSNQLIVLQTDSEEVDNLAWDSEGVTDSASAMNMMDNRDECQVVIRLQPSHRLTVVFTVFETSGYDCAGNEASTEVVDSTSLRTRRFCESQPKFSWTSDANEVLMKFHRYDAMHRLRVEARFRPFERPEHTESGDKCSKVLTANSMVIESVYHPRHYPANLNCYTVVQAPPDQRIRIVFSVFHLEGLAGSDCDRDYLEISDLATMRTDRACGTLNRYAYTSDSNEILLRFVTDAFTNGPGYQATYVFLKRPEPSTECNITLIHDEGSISSTPNDVAMETHHGRDYHCQYLIHAPPSMRILLTFDLFMEATTNDCKRDYLEITDTAVGSTDRFCSFLRTHRFTSQGNELEIAFHSSEKGEFSATYKWSQVLTSDCDQSFTTSPQLFSSPKFSGASPDVFYANNLDCTITFLAAPMDMIKIMFLTFDLEESENCQYDYVEIRAMGEDSPVRYCGSLPEFVWTSPSNTASLRFHSDHIVAGKGFQAEYKTASMETAYECDVSLTQQSGSFTSPEYPGEYPNNRDCKYSITVEPGFVINVTFVDFQLEFHHACEYDFVEVYDELLGPSLSRRYCGPLAPFSVMSETNDVLVEFHSDTSARFRGFTAEYVAIPHKRPGSPKQVQAPLCEDQTYRDPKGSLTSPNFPYKYDNDEHCRIDIQLEDEDARVRVTFHFFDVEEHQDCTWDFVQIADNISHRMSDRLCGTQSEPLTWESDYNDVTITFRSDGLVTRTGFYATYESLAGNDETSSQTI